MCTIHASIQSRFSSVREALATANIPFSENDDSAILVWLDSLKEGDKVFQKVKPYQVINRIPNTNVLCHKAPLARIIQRIQQFFPQLYNFMPKSYILPFQNKQFVRALARDNCPYIVKPDNGSLGNGITIVEPNTEFEPDDTVAVAQVYIDSYLIDNTKFDLRIYALVTCVDPLTIYVYHGGLARFCSEETGVDAIYSRLTNVAINHNSVLIDNVVKIISEKENIDEDTFWKKIDDVVGLTIISSAPYMQKGVEWHCSPKRQFRAENLKSKSARNQQMDESLKNEIDDSQSSEYDDDGNGDDADDDDDNDIINDNDISDPDNDYSVSDTNSVNSNSTVDITDYSDSGDSFSKEDDQKYTYKYSRCFQVLGFDILFDKHLNPYVLEVNYRPSLDTHSNEERRMKIDMIRSAILIGAPLHLAQRALSVRKWAWTHDTWDQFISLTPEIELSAKESLKNAVKNSKYKLIWPSDDPDRQIWHQVYEKSITLPLEQMPGITIPQSYEKSKFS